MAIVFDGNLPWFLLVRFVLAIGAGLLAASEVVVFRRFRRADPATMMIASFGFATADTGFMQAYDKPAPGRGPRTPP